MNDRERAERYLNIGAGHARLFCVECDCADLAAEFAAIREPYEKRIATLEAALRNLCSEVMDGPCPAWSGARVVAAAEQGRATLSGAGEYIVERARAEEAAHERECCANVAESWAGSHSNNDGFCIAAAIRERGKR